MVETMIVYGNCQAESLVRLLNQIPDVARRFHVLCQFTADQEPMYDDWQAELRKAAVVLIQDIEQAGAYPMWAIPESDRPRWMRYPMAALPSLWPFDTAFGGRDDTAARLSAARHGHGLIFYDALQAALRPIQDRHVRYRAYRDIDHAGLDTAARLIRRRDIGRLFDFDVLRLQASDARLGSNVGRYILANFRNRRLFHTIAHPTVETLYMIAIDVLGRLGISLHADGALTDHLESLQVPVHPRVATTLGVEWATPDLGYRYREDEMTFEQYHHRYMHEFG